MNEKEAAVFYQKQFDLSKDKGLLSEITSESIEELFEQVGRDFSTVLELGAGDGAFSRELALYTDKITTIELVTDMVEYAKSLNPTNVTSLSGSFYNMKLESQFDLILYIDGFGVGSNTDQLRLLKRIYNWLTEDGVALIDIYQPQYWKKVSGTQMAPFADSTITRVYGYDEALNQMTDTWWDEKNPDDKQTQRLACYTVDEIYDLCEQAHLKIVAYYPGGAMDYENWEYHEKSSLSDCLSYRIKVIKE